MTMSAPPAHASPGRPSQGRPSEGCPSLAARLVKWAFTLSFFLLPAFLGFGNKFREFLMLWGDEEGAFTLMPILNYLLASLGFFFMLCWATSQGMFRDMEGPKETMLKNEEMLDDAEARGLLGPRRPSSPHKEHA